jgi:hypothetical protein
MEFLQAEKKKKNTDDQTDYSEDPEPPLKKPKH